MYCTPEHINELCDGVRVRVDELEDRDLVARLRLRVARSSRGRLATVRSFKVRELDEALAELAELLHRQAVGDEHGAWLRVDLLDGSGHECAAPVTLVCVAPADDQVQLMPAEPVQVLGQVAALSQHPAAAAQFALAESAAIKSLSRELVNMARAVVSMAATREQTTMRAIDRSFAAVAEQHQAEAAAAVAYAEMEHGSNERTELLKQTAPVLVQGLKVLAAKKTTDPAMLAELVKKDPDLVGRVVAELDDETKDQLLEKLAESV